MMSAGLLVGLYALTFLTSLALGMLYSETPEPAGARSLALAGLALALGALVLVRKAEIPLVRWRSLPAAATGFLLGVLLSIHIEGGMGHADILYLGPAFTYAFFMLFLLVPGLGTVVAGRLWHDGRTLPGAWGRGARALAGIGLALVWAPLVLAVVPSVLISGPSLGAVTLLVAGGAVLAALVTGLLAIARCESGSKNWKEDVVNLPELIGSVWRRFEPQAQTKGLSVHLNPPDRLPVKSNSALLQIILDNLLANAVEYSPEGGSIHLKTETAGAGSENVSVLLANTTDNLDPKDIPHLFDRFWRKDDNRTDARHSGLGLAVVKAAAQALDLEVTADWQAPNTLIVRLNGLPSTASSPAGKENTAVESQTDYSRTSN
jgi:hypothetical protein